MTRYDLECRYDSRNSFYGKAWVQEYEVSKDTLFIYELYSYGTLVARIVKDQEEDRTTYVHMGKYSQTTSRHQREFFRQFGLTDDEIKILEKNVDKEIVFE